MKTRPSSRRGFALMAVLWCLGIMAVVVGGVVAYANLQQDETISRAKDARARDLAISGLSLGFHPLVQRDDPLLTEKIGSGEICEVKIESEDGRLNLNALLVANRSDVLERLWVQWGLSPDQAQALDDCLADWVDPGDLKRLNGAKRNQYAKLGHPEYPPGRLFQTLDEVTQVIGFGTVEKLKPDWRSYFTLWSDGKLNLNEAPADLIAAVCNVGLPQAVAFVQRRDPNGRTGDPDGYHVQSVEEAASFLEIPKIDLPQATPLLTVESTLWRVQSTAMVARHRHTVVAVASRVGAFSGYCLWEEF